MERVSARIDRSAEGFLFAEKPSALIRDQFILRSLNYMSPASSGLHALCEIGNVNILGRDILADVVAEFLIEINLLEGTTDDGNCQEDAIMILLPTLIFLQNLVARVVCYARGSGFLLPRRIWAEGTAAHEVWPRALS